MNTYITKERVYRALRNNVPKSHESEVKFCMSVLVFKEKPINKWVGPHLVIARDGKMVIVNMNGTPTILNADKLKQYKSPTQIALKRSDTQAEESPLPTISDAENRSRFEKEVDDLIAPKSDMMFYQLQIEIQNFKEESCESSQVSRCGIHLTEALERGDPRALSPPFIDAKHNEVEGLKQRGTWNVILRSELPHGAKVLNRRFVNTVKNKGTGKEKAKARFFVQGHRDKEKPFIVHNVHSLRPSSTRMIFSTSSILKLCFLVTISIKPTCKVIRS